ncbi:hypothetical protein LTR33_008185 [Friedmanniomyces endolithicus]|nr:hypothetical protein LTR33_008185 [Friedmanniomyces endolithicus]
MVALSHLVRAASTLTVVLYNAVPATEVKAYLTAHESNAFRRLGIVESIAARGRFASSRIAFTSGLQRLPDATKFICTSLTRIRHDGDHPH